MAHGWHHLRPEQLQRIEESILTGTYTSGPFHLELQPTNRCNVACTFCCTKHLRDNEDLPWPLLERVLREEATRNLHYVRVIGGGEPLVYRHADDLFALLGNLGLAGFDLTTNGVLLERFAGRLVDSGCEEVYVSLNEPTAPLYAKSMQTSERQFDRVLAGIRALAAERSRAERPPRLVVQFFVDAANWQEIERMVGLATELGANVADIRAAGDTPGGPPVQRMNAGEQALFRERMQRLMKVDAALPVPIMRFSLVGYPELNHLLHVERTQLYVPQLRGFDFLPQTPRREYCYMPWYSAVLDAKAAVYGCCYLSMHETKQLGRLGEGGLQPIWLGPRFEAMRSQMRQNMLLRGGLRYSCACHTQLLPQCIGNFDCYLTFGLASAEFYDHLSARMEDTFTPLERLAARGRDTAVRTVHLGRKIAASRKA